MTIAEAIEGLHDIQKCYNDEITEAMFLGFNDTDNESVNVAIETMRKYQKVERIFKDWCEIGDDADACAFRDLKQVICPCSIGDEDENVDR